MSKQFLGVIAAIILIFVGIFVFSGNKAGDNKTGGGGKTLSQHVEGKGSSGVTLVEYGDYQCPACQAYYPTVKAAVAQFNDQIKFQFRNFPLTSIHQNAFAAARAAEAADLQGKFWEMHDTLYETSNYQVWTTASDPTVQFNQYAQNLGLDLAKFKADFASSKVNDLINADMAEGGRLGITGTPTFFVNGKQVEINNDISAFEKVIKEAIAKQTPTDAGKTTQTKS